MTIPHIITYLSMLAWILVPFRQYKRKYFAFFLILAILDPVMLILIVTLHVQSISTYIIFISFAVLSLLGLNAIKKNIAVTVVFFLASIIIAFYAPLTYLTIYLILLQIIIFIIFLSKTLSDIYINDFINTFYFVICVYEISIILKFMLYLIDVKTGVIFFYLTSAFEILVGIYFIFYNEKNSTKIKLNMSVQKN